MKDLARRTVINLVAVGVVSAVLIIYALASLLSGALLDDSYPVSVKVPRTGGLIPQQEVTLSGVPIGLVDSFELEGEHVIVNLSIDENRKIPTEVDAVILRRSAVGEQAIDFRPHPDAGDDFYAEGDVIEPAEVVTPVEVQRLLTLADKVFSPVDPENAGKLVGELADIVRGRRDDIRSIISDSAEFSADIADNGEDYDTLFREGRKVTASLAKHRKDVSRSLGDMADAAALLSDMRTDFEGLLTDAPPLLEEVTTLADRANPNLSCVISDFADLNEYMAQDRQMHNLEETLRFNQWFFVGFNIGSPYDAQGRVWNRLQFIPPQEPPARSYLPEKRPIPNILPGGACESPFGPGAGAASQKGYSKRVPDTEVIRPANDRTQPVRRSGTDASVSLAPAAPADVPAAPAPNERSRARLAAARTTGQPASMGGGTGLSFVIGLLLTAGAAPRARRLYRRNEGVDGSD